MIFKKPAQEDSSWVRLILIYPRARRFLPQSSSASRVTAAYAELERYLVASPLWKEKGHQFGGLSKNGKEQPRPLLQRRGLIIQQAEPFHHGLAVN
jgi:hypothetical protein